MDVGHADLLALVDEGAALLEEVGRRQGRAGLPPEQGAAIAADDPGVVVIFQIQAVPRLAIEAVLPAGEGLLQLAQGEGMVEILGEEAVRRHGVELDDHIQHPVTALDIPQGGAYAGHGGLADLDGAVFLCHRPELGEVGDDVGAVLIVGHAVDHRKAGDAVGQAGILGDEGDDVLPEAVHPHVQPEAHDVADLLPHGGVIHVQIRLLFVEEVEVILAPHVVVFPGRAGELAGPVVGGQAAAMAHLAVPPDVVVPIGVIAPLTALPEPIVLVGGVIDDQVHNDFEAQGVGLVQHLLKLCQRAVVGVDVAVVGHVVAVVGVGGGIEGAEPDGVHPQGLDIIQLVVHAVQIADAVAVAVAEAANPNLIEAHGAEIRLFFCHVCLTPCVNSPLFYHIVEKRKGPPKKSLDFSLFSCENNRIRGYYFI